MTPQRKVARTVTTAPPAPGFAGPGHTAVFAIDPSEFAQQDPFIMMADDRLDLPEGATIGGEHPHAGFEIATFLLEGSVFDQDEGALRAGDLQWMVTGSGVIHGEHVTASPRTRLLQLWYALPEEERWKAPSFGTITREHAEIRKAPGVEVRGYAGASGMARDSEPPASRLIIVEAKLDAGVRLVQEVPAAFNAFLYVLDGEVRVGEGDGVLLRSGQIGWLDRPEGNGTSALTLVAGDAGARAVLYAGEPQHVSIAMHGPFVGGSRADLMRMSRDWMDGRFQRMSALVRAAKAKGAG
jgi:quercetin 2,3-dioxygenase